MFELAGPLLARLLFSGPLLYVGLTMVVDPASFARGLNDLSRGLEAFKRHFDRSSRVIADWNSAYAPSSGECKALRVFGLTLVLCALLPLTGLLD